MKYRLGLYEKAMPAEFAWAEKLKTAQRLGYDYLEISIDETEGRLARLDWDSATRRDLLSTISSLEIPIGSMCLSGHRKHPLGSPDASIRKRGMQIMEKAINFAAALGIPLIQLAGYDTYYTPGNDQTRAWFIENLHKATALAACAGVLLGFETMETPFMDTVQKAMAYVALVDSPYLQVYPDIGNLSNAALLYGVPVRADLDAGRGHIAAVHLKETVPGHYREIPFGRGHVDFAAIIEQTWSMGVRRYVTEMWDVGDGRWEQEIVQACGMMRGILNNMQESWQCSKI